MLRSMYRVLIRGKVVLKGFYARSDYIGGNGWGSKYGIDGARTAVICLGESFLMMEIRMNIYHVEILEMCARAVSEEGCKSSLKSPMTMTA